MLKYIWLIIITVLLWVLGCKETVNESNPLEKSLELLNPNGGELFQLNDTINVSWESKNVNEFNLFFSVDSGASWTKIAENIKNVSEFKFLNTDSIKSDICLTKIEDFSDKSVFDISDEIFSINQLEPETIEPELRIFSEHSSNYPNKAPLSFSADDEYLFSYSPDIWGEFFPTNIRNVNTGELVNKIPTRFLSSNPSQNMVVGINLAQDSVGLWDPLTSEKLESFPTWYPFDAKVSHNGKYLAIARTRWIDVWDLETKEHLHNIVVREFVREDNFHTIEFSPDDKMIASANDKLRIFDVQSGLKIIELNRGHSFSIKFLPDGKQIVVGGIYGIVNIWNIQTGEKISEFSADDERVYSIDLSEDGNKLLIGTKSQMLLWNLMENIQDTIVYSRGSLGVAYSNNSKYVAGKSGDKLIVYGPMR